MEKLIERRRNSNIGKSKSGADKILLFKQILVLVTKISLLILIIISLSLLAINKFKPEIIEPARTEVFAFFEPVGGQVNKLLYSMKLIWGEINNVLNAGTNARKVQQFEQDNFKLALELLLLKKHNEELKRNLDYISRFGIKAYSARIISRSPGPYVKSAFIESDDIEKIEKADVVINQEGLVGQVESIDQEAGIAQIILITDKRSNVPVKTKNEGIRAILAGNTTLRPNMDYMLDTKKLIVGEEILTSGDAGVFPPDIPIGYIEEIVNDMVYVETYADWSSLDYVFILK